jgi:hypothetical protein
MTEIFTGVDQETPRSVFESSANRPKWWLSATGSVTLRKKATRDIFSRLAEKTGGHDLIDPL